MLGTAADILIKVEPYWNVNSYDLAIAAAKD